MDVRQIVVKISDDDLFVIDNAWVHEVTRSSNLVFPSTLDQHLVNTCKPYEHFQPPVILRCCLQSDEPYPTHVGSVHSPWPV